MAPNNEKTFTTFTPAQAAAYALGRGGSYPPELYHTILSYHGDTRPRNLLLDVGTGPGKVIFDLLPSFTHAIGTDSSASMIAQARLDAEKAGVTAQTSWEVCVGEKCDSALSPQNQGTVDVITVAMAAHWLDMPAFYGAACRALRPGGTLAMWTCSSYYVHPSEPNAREIQEALFALEDGFLDAYREPGHRLTRGAYEGLVLPWSSTGTATGHDGDFGFEQSSFVRKDWDRDGVPSAPPEADGSPGPFLRGSEESLDELEAGLGSASLVIKWRAANPELAHTEKDPVAITMKRLRDAAGAKKTLKLAPSVSLLLMRKKE